MSLCIIECFGSLDYSFPCASSIFSFSDYKVLLQKYGIDLDKMNADEEESLFGLNFPLVSLKEDAKEWL